MVFARKLERMVTSGHMDEAPTAVMTYTSVVTYEPVRVALTIAAMNDLEVNASNVMNA
jgi:hypothetical protein